MRRYTPALNRSLELRARSESFLYRSNAKFGFKPVFSITQVLIYRTVREGRPWVFIALKQIYADHYIASSLGVAI
jgi:hypothetical protein